MQLSQFASTTLEDEYVKLEPMTLQHAAALHEAGKFSAIWRWTTHPYCLTQEATNDWVASCLRNVHDGTQIPFVIVDKQSNTIVGSSSYLNISLEHKTIEIGYTFLTPASQRSYINRRNKLLLLTHAFETLKVNRVALQTHEKNDKSRNAILGLGAQFEGIQRNCRIQYDGSIRSSAFYSIIKPEWSSTKAALLAKIERAELSALTSSEPSAPFSTQT